MIDLTKVQPNFVTPTLNDKIWLFYGEMGTRKTSVSCQFKDHLLFAFDIGYKLINGAMAVPMQKWSDFKNAVKQLDNPEIKNKYKVIIIDTIGMAYQACYMYMLTQMGVSEPSEAGAFGMGWKKIRNEFETVIRSIAQKGYGLIMLAHSDEVEKEDKVTKQKILVTKIDIDKRPDLIIKGLADFVFFLHKEEKEDGTPTVFAYTNLVSIDTKSRSRYLSPKFEFNYETLQQEINNAINKQYQEEQIAIPESIEYTNPYAEEEVDFASLQKKVQDTALELMEKGQETQVSTLLLSIFKGIKISELTQSKDNIEKLKVALSSMEDLLN